MAPLRTTVPSEGLPHVALVCGNLTPPGPDGRATLRFSEVKTLFHEFGHLVHQLFSKVTVRGLAGTNVAWDFVELPSQIHENFLYVREVIDLCTAHVETGAPLPETLFAALLRARAFRQGSATMRQLAFAEMDLALHRVYEPEAHGDVLDFARGYIQHGTPARLPATANAVASFTHLFSGPVAYAAGYYSYKWAEVLEADAFETLAPGQRVSEDAGRRFREVLLSRGDAQPPEALFEAFVGRGPDLDALLRRAGLAA
jgi:oligopeptidase A